MNRERIYMLAADQRWQWEEWCDAQGVPRERIPEAKAAAVEGFLLARERSPRIREAGALLLDPLYSGASIRRAIEAGVVVGTPVEAAGVFPLAWDCEPFWKPLQGSFVKVLVKHRPDHPAAVQSRHREMLLELQAWCRAQQRVFLLEVLVPAAGEAEAEIDARRPAILADYIGAAYAAGLVPELWKLEGTPDAAGAALVDRAIAARPGPRLVILGKGASIQDVGAWFAAARGGGAAAGFAIGRTTYWKPATRLLLGEIDAAAAAIAASYEQLIGLWEGDAEPAP